MDWISLDSVNQLEQIATESKNKFEIVFKHSTRCPLSTVAKMRLQSKWTIPSDQILFYYLDIIKHRDISNELAERYQVKHESPQILLIRDDQAVYDNSHLDISIHDIESVLV